jgi:hypothetical protein
MRMSYLTLQLLYYRSWVSRIKYTHVKAGTICTRESRNTRKAGTHGKPEHTESRNTPILSLCSYTYKPNSTKHNHSTPKVDQATRM